MLSVIARLLLSAVGGMKYRRASTKFRCANSSASFCVPKIQYFVVFPLDA